MKKQSKKVHLLHTGGTIGMNLKGDVDPSSLFLEILKRQVPEIFDIADLSAEVLFNKDSSNMLPADWLHLARRIDQLIDTKDAFVITHGTDTMAFTAAALSFVLEHCPRPVILTGSQKPLSDPKSDGARNLLNAVELAVEAQINEVAIFFDSTLMRGNRAKKISIPSFRAFESPNFPPLARVGVKTEYMPAEVPAGPYRFDPRIETQVIALSLFPGMDSEIFSTILNRGFKGVLLQAFGPGDIPLGELSTVNLIRSLTERGVPTVICSQAIFGRVDLSLYETGRAAARSGAISALDMTWECALVKMMTLLGRGLSLEPFRTQFTKNLAGELTED